MEENDIDKYFKSEKDSEYLDPPAFVWDSLEQDLKKRKKKKRFFVWWFAGLFFVLGLSAYLFQKLDLTQVEYSELDNSTKKDSKSDLDVVPQIKSNKMLAETVFQPELPSLAGSNTDENNAAKSENQTKKSIPLTEFKRDLKQNITSNSITQNRSQSSMNTEDSSKTPLFSNNEPGSKSITNDIESSSQQENASSRELFGQKVENDFLIRDVLTVPILEGSQIDLFLFSRNLKKPKHSHLKPTKVNNKKPNTIALAIHLGKPNFSNVASGQESIPEESDWYSYGLGISYQREITDGLYLRSGINYRQSKRKFNYESEDISLQGYEQRLSTPTIPHEYGRLVSEGEQRFSFTDISIGLNYEVWSQGVRVSVGMDAILNLQLRSEGKTLDNDQSIIRYTNDDNLYQSSLGVGISPSVNIDFPIHENFNLTLSPRFVSYFQDLENEVLLRDLRYSNFGLDLGLSRKF